MAMVLLGVPRGQNFVAEAADEATKSVALLTLTLTGNEEEPLEAEMDWKSFVQGTTVGLEVIFVDEEGNASGPLDYGTWLDTYGSMESDDAGFKTFAPAAWLAALPSGEGAGDLFGAGWFPALLPCARALLATRDWFAALPLAADGYGAPAVPGLARLALGSSLSVAPHPTLASLTGVTSVAYVAAVTDSSVVSFDSDSSSIVGVGVGTTTISLSCSYSVGDRQFPLAPLGSLAVEVYNPPVPVTGVSLIETTKTLAVGESFDLTATISPENATNKAVKWTSSEPNVASVDENGTVKALKAGKTTITVTTEDGDHTATCGVTVTEAGGAPPDSTPDTPPADTPAASAYLEATVDVKGHQQRLRVYDPNNVLPDGTKFEALAVTEHEHLDNDHEIEHLLSYNLSLLDAAGNPLHMPLDAPVELCFEVLDGLDKDELEVVLVQEFDDAEFEENLVDLDGASWVKVKTNHFSPYVLIDKLTPEEKGVQIQDGPGNATGNHSMKTGDASGEILLLSPLAMIATGLYLVFYLNKKKSF